MNKKSYRDILDSAAADSLSRQTNLMPKISAQLERKPLMTLRTRPIVAVLIAFLILFALSGVVYALGKALGYIPGVGLVDQSVPIRLLATPVTVEQHGISVTVSKVIADSTRTFVSYRVDGIPFVENQIPACVTPPELHLPDGSNLENRTGSGGNAIRRDGDFLSYTTESVFAPMANAGTQAVFVLHCVFPDERDPEPFELALNLIPAPADYATPAVEIVVTSDGSEHTTGLHLEKVVVLDNSYILIGKFTDGGDLEGPLYMTTSSDSEYLPRIEDANGKPVSFKVREDVRPEPEWDVAYYWAYEIPKSVSMPLTITVDQVNLRKDSTTQIEFDAGDNPKIGQEWNFNQTVTLGAYTFTLDKITFLGNGYILHISYEELPPSASLYVDLVDDPLNPLQFDNRNEATNLVGNELRHTITLTAAKPPIGKLTLTWQLEEAIPQPGPWTLVWRPSETKP